MTADDWVPLAVHTAPWGLQPCPTLGELDLLAFEAALTEQGIEVAYDPHRPGENGLFLRDSLRRPTVLLVRAGQLECAQRVAYDLGFDSLLVDSPSAT